MILTVDVGNSRIKWASWMAERIVARGVAAYQKEKVKLTLDELFAAVEKPVTVYAVSVAGEHVSEELRMWVKAHWHHDVAFLRTEKQFKELINAYEDPLQHGADRWAAVAAGVNSYTDSSLCIINAGTAVTIDLVNKGGQHLGGYILPSYTTMHAALLSDTANMKATAGVPEFDVPFLQDRVPDNTSDAINYGLHKLLQSGLREICHFAEDKLAAPMKILLTGGAARVILKYPEMPEMSHKPDLVMQGLYDIMKNKKDGLKN